MRSRPGNRFFYYCSFWFFQDRGQFLKMGLLDNWVKSEARGRTLRETLGTSVAFQAALSTASFPFFSCMCRNPYEGEGYVKCGEGVEGEENSL